MRAMWDTIGLSTIVGSLVVLVVYRLMVTICEDCGMTLAVLGGNPRFCRRRGRAASAGFATVLFRNLVDAGGIFLQCAGASFTVAAAAYMFG